MMCQVGMLGIMISMSREWRGTAGTERKIRDSEFAGLLLHKQDKAAAHACYNFYFGVV
ncbi:hypothetical protein SAMN06298226_2481 [Nitrosovibrio sp. Nv4]|nr:hypothetical protein SAMN06298226_2481 [Nitrosovibrio sp. Nv4]